MTRCERKKFTAAVNEFRRQIPIRAAMASRVPFSELSEDVRQEILDYLNEKLFEWPDRSTDRVSPISAKATADELRMKLPLAKHCEGTFYA